MTRLTTLETSQFRKDRKRLLRQRKNLEELLAVIEILADGKILPLKYRDHALTENWIGFRECHI